jgi:phosphomannomutase
VPEMVKKLGGKAIRSEVGYANVKNHMEKENGIIGGEVSGHFSFKKNYYSDCAYAALLIILEILSLKNKKLSTLIEKNQIYYRANELNITIDDIPLALNKLRDKYKENIRDEIDGLTVEFYNNELLNWWFNVRASNTEPLLRITVEAKDKETAEKYQKELLEIINN